MVHVGRVGPLNTHVQHLHLTMVPDVYEYHMYEFPLAACPRKGQHA